MTLAIQGHPKRGSKVIEILEMLGGNNIYNLSGNSCNIYYIIEGFEREIRIRESIFDNENICLFTLEEFEEKFPYKIGDKVWLHYENLTIRISETITSMRWCSKDNCVLYDVCTCCNLKEYAFTPYKEETMEERKNSVVVNIEHNQLKVDSLRFDKTQLMINDEYELKQEGDTYYIVRKKIQ